MHCNFSVRPRIICQLHYPPDLVSVPGAKQRIRVGCQRGSRGEHSDAVSSLAHVQRAVQRGGHAANVHQRRILSVRRCRASHADHRQGKKGKGKGCENFCRLKVECLGIFFTVYIYQGCT